MRLSRLPLLLALSACTHDSDSDGRPRDWEAERGRPRGAGTGRSPGGEARLRARARLPARARQPGGLGRVGPRRSPARARLRSSAGVPRALQPAALRRDVGDLRRRRSPGQGGSGRPGYGRADHLVPPHGGGRGGLDPLERAAGPGQHRPSLRRGRGPAPQRADPLGARRRRRACARYPHQRGRCLPRRRDRHHAPAEPRDRSHRRRRLGGDLRARGAVRRAGRDQPRRPTPRRRVRRARRRRDRARARGRGDPRLVPERALLRRVSGVGPHRRRALGDCARARTVPVRHRRVPGGATARAGADRGPRERPAPRRCLPDRRAPGARRRTRHRGRPVPRRRRRGAAGVQPPEGAPPHARGSPLQQHGRLPVRVRHPRRGRAGGPRLSLPLVRRRGPRHGEGARTGRRARARLRSAAHGDEARRRPHGAAGRLRF